MTSMLVMQEEDDTMRSVRVPDPELEVGGGGGEQVRQGQVTCRQLER
jgi:hypothetical protein